MLDPMSIMLWIKVGAELVSVGKTTIQHLRTAVADDPTANIAVLDQLDADYQKRTDRRENTPGNNTM